MPTVIIHGKNNCHNDWILPPFSAWSQLTCNCNSQMCVSGDRDECVTSIGVCFVRVSISVDAEKMDEYACLELTGNTTQRPECLDGPVVDEFTSIQCCNDADRCNKHLNPPLPPYFQTIVTFTMSHEDPTMTTTPIIIQATTLRTISLPWTGNSTLSMYHVCMSTIAANSCTYDSAVL